MFTGLIEEIGVVGGIATTDSGSTLTIQADHVLSDARIGDSIAIDGVCTTVISLDASSFTIEASPETLSKTTFGRLEAGSRVNLERPLLPTSRLGGHFVSGHVDGTALVISREQEGISWIYHFRVNNPELAPLLVEKGSVAVNGISLTVNTVEKQVFSVAIIPHTLTHTNLEDYGPDSTVNIETDLLGKYVQRLLPMQAGQAAPASTFPEPVEVVGRSTIRTGIWFNLEKPEESSNEHTVEEGVQG